MSCSGDQFNGALQTLSGTGKGNNVQGHIPQQTGEGEMSARRGTGERRDEAGEGETRQGRGRGRDVTRSESRGIGELLASQRGSRAVARAGAEREAAKVVAMAVEVKVRVAEAEVARVAVAGAAVPMVEHMAVMVAELGCAWAPWEAR